MTRAAIFKALVLATVVTSLGAAEYVPSSLRPPTPAREFRGAWIATVHNIDWPTQEGLDVHRQKAEMAAQFDRAAQLRLNAVLFQVRPACDALYASKIEPWSEYLTGRMGQPPKPFYDPLAFAVEEAHRRGLEIHAWFNPFRARHSTGKSPPAPNHVSRLHPNWVRTYGSQLWLDPGEKAAQDYSVSVILDVVRRYDIDGVHFDDYFYPYPVKDAAGREIDFPDGPSWDKYRARGGRLNRTDWRRQTVDELVQRCYAATKAEKRWVKFGISPFGIWRPGFPAQIRGFDAYASLYADSRKWLQQGWLDYLAPQLYWATADKEQSYPVLLAWWAQQNNQQRHLWPGNSCYRHSAQEILNQIRLTRRQPGASGNVHLSMKVLAQNKNGLSEKLFAEPYAQPALVPASTWLDHTPPERPSLTAHDVARSRLKLNWSPSGAEGVWLWLLQTKTGGQWATEILTGSQREQVLQARAKPEVIALTAVDRCGNASLPAVLER